MQEQFTFYFGLGSVFSHWFKSKFIIDNQTYCCVEQYIMYKKALLFNDLLIANKILKSSDPKRHRYLGKHVSGFIKSVWQNKCRQYAYEANLAKFNQNKELMKTLIETRGNSLAETSPYDRIWGIGLSLSNPKIYNRLQWRGKNLAGEVLESVRTELLKQSPPLTT